MKAIIKKDEFLWRKKIIKKDEWATIFNYFYLQ